MIPKKTMEIVALVLFDRYCKELDVKFSIALNQAFDGERISKKRVERIGDKFIEKLHGGEKQ